MNHPVAGSDDAARDRRLREQADKLSRDYLADQARHQNRTVTGWDDGHDPLCKEAMPEVYYCICDLLCRARKQGFAWPVTKEYKPGCLP